MSQIDELIAELAPHGVLFRTLGEVIADLRTGLNPRQNFKLNTPGAEHKYITVRELGGFDVRPTDKTDLIDSEGLARIQARSRLRRGDVLLSGTGTIGRTALVAEDPQSWNIKEGVYAITPNPAMIDPRFLIYLLHSSGVRSRLLASADGSTVASVPMARLRQLRIPTPPLPVQQEIVRILDQFTELEVELEAELEARRNQYRHYKHALLSVPSETEWGRVGDVCRVFGGAPFKSSFFNDRKDGLPVVRIRDINSGFSGTYYSGPFEDKYRVRDGDILIGMDGDFKAVRWAHGDGVLNQRVSRLQDFNDETDPSFVFYLVREAIRHVQDLTQASTVKHLSAKQIASIQVPRLSLNEQRLRSAALDKFDTLASDLSIGLPAELAARRKQYEYYRDKLLTFEEASA